MPLERASGDPQTNVDALYFPMKDVKKGVRVACKVAYELLEDAGNVRTQDMSKMAAVFERKRDFFKSIASAQYDKGIAFPHVTHADL